MIDEPLDFKRAVQLLARHKVVMLGAVLLGLISGVVWGMLRPPTLKSEAWVALPTSTRGGVGTQVVIAGSDEVLTRALRGIDPGMSLQTLRDTVDVASRTGTLIVVDATGPTAARAENTANAVAQSYVDYVRQRENLPDGPVQARVWQPATAATGTKESSRVIAFALLGAAVGGVIAALGVLAVSRRDRRLRERDAIADSIGVPVVASIAVQHPSDAAGWRRLLEEYRPGAVDAWRMRKALQYLGLVDVNLKGHPSTGLTVTVISSSVDRKALALGPQLAAFAASLGVPTALVVGPQQDVAAVATLRAACAASPHEASDRLRVVVRDHADPEHEPDVALTVVVLVVDAQSPHVSDLIRTKAAVLGVSAGVATAEELARVAASAAVGGLDIVGILVADPDPADSTTGRLPHVERPAQHRRPTRMTGTRRESER
jgi:capsular polysaccharide biosynthesis protein